MKKKILLCLSVLILAASCGQSAINSNKESEVANQQKIVEEPFTGQTYDLNQTDFNLDINNLLYYKGSIFNGRVKFKTTAGEGYYTFQNGALNGAFQIIKNDKNTETGLFKNNKLVFIKNSGTTTTEISYSLEGKLASYSLLSKEGNLKFSSFDPIKGEVSKSGKSYPIITTNSGSGEALVKENDGLYVYKYSITPDFSGNYSISESKFKADSNNFKYLIYVGTKELGTQENINNITFEEIMSVIGNPAYPTTGATPTTSALPPLTQQGSTPTQSASVSAEDYLSLLNRVYDEVINKGNTAYLNSFSKDQLGFLRNTIYARRGFIFTTDKYKNYFSSKSWYRGVNSNYDTLGLSSQELKLASLIKSKE